MTNYHQVIAKSLDSILNPFAIIAGTGTAGSTASMLNYPYGIFVDINFDLYVVDCHNNRIQLFQLGQSNAVTVAGNGASGTITLNYPTGVVLDADKYLFIVDQENHRIVASGPNGFRCIVGCAGGGSASNQLWYPRGIAFDSYGNIFVVDTNNNRIQQFLLATNSCGMYINT
jgi:DNA-binding beta-propeller fold protein YncE